MAVAHDVAWIWRDCSHSARAATNHQRDKGMAIRASEGERERGRLRA